MGTLECIFNLLLVIVVFFYAALQIIGLWFHGGIQMIILLIEIPFLVIFILEWIAMVGLNIFKFF
jgi:hypothetical protein